MNDKIKRFAFYNIFFLCAFCCLFMVLSVNSYASNFNIDITLSSEQGQAHYILTGDDDYRYCLYKNAYGNCQIMSNYSHTITGSYYSGDNYQYISWSITDEIQAGVYRCSVFSAIGSSIDLNIPFFDDFESAIDYIETGNIQYPEYINDIELDSFKVTTWGIGNLQILFKSRFEVVWSDERISKVQVVLQSTGGKVSFESSSSPFKQKFEPENYVLKKGDVVHLVATPYTSDGSYGTSLYYSFVYDDNVPGSNIYRKFTNTPYSDNTITIPYTSVSGQPQSVNAPVDGITTNNTYKVNYNPITYEYGDLNLYEVYYSPVIVYPSDTPTEEIDETQDVINNTYTTNNYYETTKNINIDFDVSFGDISGSDIQHGFDDFGNFGNGFGGFIGKLSSWVLALFPFLSPVVASAIVFMFGLIILLAIIALVLKIASVIADLFPF